MQTWLVVLGVLAVLILDSGYAHSYQNPVEAPLGESGAVIADPGVLRWMGKYYLYATKVTEDDGLRCWESDNLVDWRFRGNCIGRDPVLENQMAWNPAPFYYNGKFYLYVCGPDQRHKVFAADQPWGPFECANPDLLDVKALDAQLFLDDDGALYLTYSGWGGIQYRKCSSPIKADGPNHQLKVCVINAQDTNVWTEGPDLVKADGTYYLSYCGNDWRSDNYQVHTSRGSSIDALSPQPGNPLIIETGGSWVATGCSHIVRGPDLKSRYAVYHCRRKGGHVRKLCVDKAHIDEKARLLHVEGPTWTRQPNPALPTWHEDFAREDLSPHWKQRSGEWAASGDRHITGTPEGSAQSAELLCMLPTGPDFVAEFNIRPGDAPDGAPSRFGVILCDDDANRLLLLLDTASRTLELRRSLRGTSLAKSVVPRNIDLKTWHTIYVEKEQGRLRAYLDGMLRIDQKVECAGGKLGLISIGRAADFGWCGFSNLDLLRQER